MNSTLYISGLSLVEGTGLPGPRDFASAEWCVATLSLTKITRRGVSLYFIACLYRVKNDKLKFQSAAPPLN